MCFHSILYNFFHSQIVVSRLSLHLLLATARMEPVRTKVHAALNQLKLNLNPHFELGFLYMRAIFHIPPNLTRFRTEFYFKLHRVLFCLNVGKAAKHISTERP